MKRCSVLFFLLLPVLGLFACTYNYEPWTPDTGVWYCSDLNARFTFGDNGDPTDPNYIPTIDEEDNHIIINGDRIASLCGRRYGSEKVTIICQEEEHPDYKVGDTICAFDFVSLSDTEYVLKDETGKRYTFVRIGDTPSDD